MSKKWKQIDFLMENFPYFLEEGDKCYYAREYLTCDDKNRKSYSLSFTNQQINNLKISPKESRRLIHKQNAINLFTEELASLLISGLTVAFIPPSKIKNDPNYDNRYEQVVNLLEKKYNIDLIVEEPIRLKENMTPSHLGGSRRLFSEKIEYVGFQKFVPDSLIVIDDVISSGRHFKSYKDLLQKKNKHLKVIGLFWAINKKIS